jgi:hypothetical protein
MKAAFVASTEGLTKVMLIAQCPAQKSSWGVPGEAAVFRRVFAWNPGPAVALNSIGGTLSAGASEYTQLKKVFFF